MFFEIEKNAVGLEMQYYYWICIGHRCPLVNVVKIRQADPRQMFSPVKCISERAIYANLVLYVYVFNMYVNKMLPRMPKHILTIRALAQLETMFC